MDRFELMTKMKEDMVELKRTIKMLCINIENAISGTYTDDEDRLSLRESLNDKRYKYK